MCPGLTCKSTVWEPGQKSLDGNMLQKLPRCSCIFIIWQIKKRSPTEQIKFRIASCHVLKLLVVLICAKIQLDVKHLQKSNIKFWFIFRWRYNSQSIEQSLLVGYEYHLASQTKMVELVHCHLFLFLKSILDTHN